MRESLKEIIEAQSSAVLMNVHEDVLDDLVDFIESYQYPYEIINSSGSKGTVRLGFINGLNEYLGSEEFVKSRVFQELSAINEIFKIELDDHFLQYIVEWIYNLHVMHTPLNYLDNDQALFDYLIEFFEDKHYESESVEDEVALKFLRVAEELLYSEEELPIMQFRDKLFKRPSILIISEESVAKAAYVERLIKDYYDQYLKIEELEDGLIFMKVQN